MHFNRISFFSIPLGALLLLVGGAGCAYHPHPLPSWKQVAHSVDSFAVEPPGFPESLSHAEHPGEVVANEDTESGEREEKPANEAIENRVAATDSATDSAIATVLSENAFAERNSRPAAEPVSEITNGSTTESISSPVTDAVSGRKNDSSLFPARSDESALAKDLTMDRWMRNYTPRTGNTEELVKAFERKQLDPYAHLNKANKSDADAAKRMSEYANTVLSRFRWYHHELDAWEAALRGEERPVPAGKSRTTATVPVLRGDERIQLALFLAHENVTLRTNAAILLTRITESVPQPGASTDRIADSTIATILHDAANDSSLSMPQRAAAVEMLGRSPDVDTNTLHRLTRSLFDATDSHSSSKRMQEQATPLRLELLHGLADRMKPWECDIFRTALLDPEKEIRLEAVRHWKDNPPISPSTEDVASRAGATNATHLPELPEEIAGLARRETDSRVLGELLITLAAWKHPDALRNIRIALEHQNAAIKFAAIDALGWLGGPEAMEYLYARYGDVSPQVRLRVVRALHRLGEEDAVYRKADDKALEVRLEVVSLIEKKPTPKTLELARKMLNDSSSDIVRATLRATAPWPTATVGPMLLDLMNAESPVVRALATEALGERWAPATTYEYRDLPKYRAEALAVLRRDFEQDISRPDSERQQDSYPEARAPGSAHSGSAHSRKTSKRVAAILADLEAGDVQIRRPAAIELHAEARRLPLSPDAIVHIAAVVERENDPITLVPLLDTLIVSLPSNAAPGNRKAGPSAPETSVVLDAQTRNPLLRCAKGCRSHSGAEVRKRAAQLAGTLRSDEAVPILLPVLDDPNPEVVRAAIGALQMLADEIERGSRQSETLTALLLLRRNPSALVRVDAAVLLNRFGEPTGRDMLTRLARSKDDSIRLYVAQRLAETGDRAFTPEMIRFLDDNGSVRRVALEALPRMVGRDFGESENRFAAENNGIRARIERWKNWAEKESALP